MGKTAWLAAWLLLSGCTATKYVPVETVRTEDRDRVVERISTDTVKDTRFIWVKGDTVFHYREKEKVRTVELHDTCYVDRVETVRTGWEPTRWEKAKMDFGGWGMGIAAISIIFAAVWSALRLRRWIAG